MNLNELKKKKLEIETNISSYIREEISSLSDEGIKLKSINVEIYINGNMYDRTKFSYSVVTDIDIKI